jgi:hypothetical protein
MNPRHLFLLDDYLMDRNYNKHQLITFVIMPENFVQFVLGAHEIQIDTDKFDARQYDSSVNVTTRDNSGLKATISIERIPQMRNRDEIYRDTISRDPLGILHQMTNIATSQEAAIFGFNINLIINGHQGFDVIGSARTLAAYRICFWLENDVAIDIFAASPADVNIKEEIIALATSILVN